MLTSLCHTVTSWHHITSCHTISFCILALKGILSIFYGRRIPTEVFVPCRRKKNKNKIPGVRFFFFSETFGRFWLFLDRKGKILLSSHHVGGKNKMALRCQFFFPCRGQFHLIGGLVAHRIYWDWPRPENNRHQISSRSIPVLNFVTVRQSVNQVQYQKFMLRHPPAS